MPAVAYSEYLYPMEGRIIQIDTTGDDSTATFEFQRTYRIQPAVVGVPAVNPDTPFATPFLNINVFFTDISMTGATINTSVPYKGLVHVHVQGSRL